MRYFNGRDNIEVESLTSLLNMSQETANKIAIGPQEDFLIKLETINRELRFADLGEINVNKKWNWKPGSYDRIKELIQHKLFLNKKSNGMDYLISRTHDRMNYLSYIKNQAFDMEAKRSRLKHLGVSPDVDLDVFKQQCADFVENMNNQSEKITKIFNEKIELNTYIKIDEHRNYSAFVYFDIYLYDFKFNIFQGRDSNAKSIQEIELEPIHIVIQCDFRKLINNMNVKPDLRGKYLSEESSPNSRRQVRAFPYISSGYGDSYGSVCLDSYMDEAYKAIRRKDLISLCAILQNWAQYYNVSFSNPYTQPHYLFLGIPEYITDEYKCTFSEQDVVASCPSRVNKLINTPSMVKNKFPTEGYLDFVNVCDTSICTVRDACPTYISNINKLNLINSDWMHQAESFAGWLLEEFKDKSFKLNKVRPQQDRNYDLLYFFEEFTGGGLNTSNHRIVSDSGHIIGTDDMEEHERIGELWSQIVLDGLIDYLVNNYPTTNGLLRLIRYSAEDYQYYYWGIETKTKPISVSSEDEDKSKMEELMKLWAISSERSQL